MSPCLLLLLLLLCMSQCVFVWGWLVLHCVVIIALSFKWLACTLPLSLAKVVVLMAIVLAMIARPMPVQAEDAHRRILIQHLAGGVSGLIAQRTCWRDTQRERMQRHGGGMWA